MTPDFLKEPAMFERAFPKWGFAIWRGLMVVGIVAFLGAVAFGALHGFATLRSDYNPPVAIVQTASPALAAPPKGSPVNEIPMKAPPGSMGSNNTLYGNVKPPPSIGSGNTIVGPTDNRGNTIIRPPAGGLAVGAGAKAGPGGVSIGAGAGSGIKPSE